MTTDGPGIPTPPTVPSAAGPFAPPPAPPRPPLSPEARRRRRARWILAGLGVVALLGGAVGGGIALLGRGETPASCIEGRWNVDAGSLEGRGVALPGNLAELGENADVEITGTQEYVFDDGVVETRYRKQRITISMPQGDGVVGSVVETNGTVVGTYQVSGERLSIADQQGEQLTSTVKGMINGEEFDMPAGGETPTAALGDVTYTLICHGDLAMLVPSYQGQSLTEYALELNRL